MGSIIDVDNWMAVDEDGLRRLNAKPAEGRVEEFRVRLSTTNGLDHSYRLCTFSMARSA